MICLICRQAQTESSAISMRFGRQELRAVIHHVPAQVCGLCGESYLDEETAQALLITLEQVFEDGILDFAQDYADEYPQ